jgi:hypothetical protein
VIRTGTNGAVGSPTTLIGKDPLMTAAARIVPWLLAATLISACAKPEDPARAALRVRLKQSAPLSNADLGPALDEVGRSIAGRTVRAKTDTVTRELNREQLEVVLGMLTNHVGVYDEGLRTEGGTTLRVVNAPGVSASPEYSAARKLWIDVDTFLPRRFEFSYEFQGMGDYSFDLVVGP